MPRTGQLQRVGCGRARWGRSHSRSAEASSSGGVGGRSPLGAGPASQTVAHRPGRGRGPEQQLWTQRTHGGALGTAGHFLARLPHALLDGSLGFGDVQCRFLLPSNAAHVGHSGLRDTRARPGNAKGQDQDTGGHLSPPDAGSPLSPPGRWEPPVPPGTLGAPVPPAWALCRLGVSLRRPCGPPRPRRGDGALPGRTLPSACAALRGGRAVRPCFCFVCRGPRWPPSWGPGPPRGAGSFHCVSLCFIQPGE